MACLFENGSAYSAYRPSYPPELYESILRFGGFDLAPSGAPRSAPAGAAPGARPPGGEAQRRRGGEGPEGDGGEGGGALLPGVAVDIATGSGQAANDLAARFECVIAIDGSPQQLAHAARDCANVEFRLADAHATGLPGGCAELVTVAQALHWLDLPSFYLEARRILAPGGTLASWCYGLAVVEAEGHPADDALRELYGGADALGPYWDERRKKVERMYKGMEPKEGVEFETVERKYLEMRHDITVDGLVGYVSSWSSYTTYCKARGEDAGRQLLDGFKARVLRALGSGESAGTRVTLVTPMALLLAKGPVPVGRGGAGAGGGDAAA